MQGDLVAAGILRRVREVNRERSVEATGALVVGLIVTLISFGVVFWLSWLALWFFGGVWKQTTLAAAGVTGLFALASVWSAWRRHDPVSDIHIERADPRRRALEDALGFAAGVPIIRRESLAGMASILIGGPANLLDAWTLWRSRVRCTRLDASRAAAVLVQARSGRLRAADAGAPGGILYRLGLVRPAAETSEKLELEVTAAGRRLLDATAIGA